MSEKIVLIDGHSILNRAFFGLPDLTNSEGLHTNAVYGFLNIMFKILEEEQPDYLTVAFDVHAPTFRHRMYDAYKGTRKPMAEELREQVPLMKEMLRSMGITIVEREGYEADDVLGTISVMSEQKGIDVCLVSGDRDLLQLATDHVQVRIPKTKQGGTVVEDYYAADVKEHYQVTPKEFIDVKALMGDTADNIPGVPGIGEKTATALIAQYGSIESVHEHAAEVRPPRAAKNIIEYWDQAVMSKELATIVTDAPIDYDLSSAKIDGVASLYTQEAYLLCQRLDFKNLLPRFTVDVPTIDAQDYYTCIRTRAEAEAVWQRASGKPMAFYLLTKEDADIYEIAAQNDLILGMSLCFGDKDTYLFLTGEELTADDLLEGLTQTVREAVQTSADSERMTENLQASLITADLKHQLSYMDTVLASAVSTQEASVSEQSAEAPISCNPNVAEDRYEATRSCFFDRTIAAYLLNPLKSYYPYEDVAKEYCNLSLPGRAELMGKRTLEQALAECPEDLLKYACHEAYVSWKSQPILMNRLKKAHMEALFTEIEMPLVFVLSDMEREGICMDADALRDYAAELSVSITKLEGKIYEQAGEEFNINSPKQLGVILFE